MNSDMASIFQKYAEFCFQTFGDRVKTWVTIHDPYSIAWKGHGSGVHAPGIMNIEIETSYAPLIIIKCT